MTTLIAHPARAWASRVGRNVPPGVRAVLAAADPADVHAWWLDGNPLASAWTWPSLPPAPAFVVAAGSLATDLVTPHPPNWLGPGRRQLDTWCLDVAPEVPGAGEIWLVPDARQILSDIPSCLAFLRDHAGTRFGLALAPARLFEPSMVDDAEDHLSRILEGLGPLARCVILEDVAIDGDRCVPVPPGEGRLPQDHLADRLAAAVPDTIPRVNRSAEVVAGHGFA